MPGVGLEGRVGAGSQAEVSVPKSHFTLLGILMALK